MSWYGDYRDEWRGVISTVALDMGRSTQIVEKDTIQSMFLYELSRSGFPFVFKGGTALSKVFHLIKRFSEDIDLSTEGELSESLRRRSKNEIISAAGKMGLAIVNSDKIFSKRRYNRYVFRYESLFKEGLSEIVVETSFYQTAYPVKECNVDSYVTSYCENSGIKLPVSFEGDRFKMMAQSPERTFVDKVFAICDYYLKDMPYRNSRHLYDIARLMSAIDFSSELKDLIIQVRADRIQSKGNLSADLRYDISSLLTDIMKSKFYELDYKSITARLLYENYSYSDAIENGIAIVAQSGIF